MSGKFYITTAIAYTNAPPHIGFALELVQADAIARWHGLRGEKRFFLTGTDEHGRKVAKAAEEAGEDPRVFVDRHAAKFQQLTKALDISNDDFIRTSDQTRHWPGVAELWKRLAEAGDLFKGPYRGLYCDGCEAFKKPSDLVGGRCPDHDRIPEMIEEENWFFRLSTYEKKLMHLIGSNEIRILPEARKNEVIAFMAQGLEEVSFSRPRKDLSWGIPVPGDETQTIYVWADALANYLTALGFGQDPASGSRKRFDEFWPADVHVIGKDILRFHAVLWPAMLLSAKLPLPRAILVHGHIFSWGQKMSKSLGNVIDPFAMVEEFGADAVRYFLLREIPTTGDGDFTRERLREVYGSDLAHTLGNLVSRVTKLGEGRDIIPTAGAEIRDLVRRAWADYEQAFAEYRLDAALGSAMGLASFANEFIDRMQPWSGRTNFDAAMPQLAFILGTIAWMLTPFLPSTARTMFEQLGIDPRASASWDGKPLTMRKGAALFPPR